MTWRTKEYNCHITGGLCAVLTIVLMAWNLHLPLTMTDASHVAQGLHPSGPDSPKCPAHQHLYFLKVHKAASTTTYNIFARFGLVRNLTVLTLFGRTNSYPHRYFDELLPPSPQRLTNGKYDIYCEHSIYDEEYLLSKLHNDTVNIAIVREPMSHVRSAFLHYKLAGKMKLSGFDDPLAEFLKRPSVHSSRFPKAIEYTRNRVAKEFGYEGNKSRVEDYLKYIDLRFLVLVLERFPESLVVMKRKLCWSMKDILHAHARQQTYHTSTPNQTVTVWHQNWSPLDYVFYDYFSQRMEERISKQDDDFPGEVKLFKQYLENTNDFCDSVCSRLGSLRASGAADESFLSIVNEIRYFAESKWDHGFNVSGLDCLAMRYHPRVHRNAQKVRLFREYCTQSRNATKAVKINMKYCDTSLPYGLPRFLIKESDFVSPCF